MRCSWCKCPDDEHEEYRDCPLFGAGMLICNDCCNFDIEAYDPKADRLQIIGVIERVANKLMTGEEVALICQACGKNGGTLNYLLPTNRSSHVRVGSSLIELPNDGSIPLIPKTMVQVALLGIPSSGYTWTIAEQDPRMVLVSQHFEAGSSNPPPGSQGLQVFTFAIEESGDYSLVMVYHRPWLTDEPKERMAISFQVKAQS